MEAAGPDGDMEIVFLRGKGGAGEGHPVFLAVEAADVEGTEEVGAEAVAVEGDQTRRSSSIGKLALACACGGRRRFGLAG